MKYYKKILSWMLAAAMFAVSFVPSAESFAAVQAEIPVMEEVQSTGTEEIVEEEVSAPEFVEGVYQISTKEEFFWFAALVNGTLQDGTPQNTQANAVLCGDVDLQKENWVPMGKYGSPYQGTFDGQGHTIENLEISGEGTYRALFGYIKDAVICNTMLAGNVTGNTNAVAGLVARGEGAFVIENCGNLATVVNENTSGYAAGLVARGAGNATIKNCFNSGSILNEADKAAGIIADIGSAMTIENCYNTGIIQAKNAVGIGIATSSVVFKNCYNAGQIEASSYAYGISNSNSSDYASAWYMSGAAASDDASHGTAMSKDQMREPAFLAILGEDNWKADTWGTANQGYPVLIWQPVKEPEEKQVQLNTPSNLRWIYVDTLTGQEVSVKDLIPDTGAAGALLMEEDGMEAADEEDTSVTPDEGIGGFTETARVTWSVVTGASSYRVKLYSYSDYYDSLYQKNKTPKPVFTAENITETSYDFTEIFGSMDTSQYGLYMFTVTAAGDGEYFVDSEESAPDGNGYCFEGTLKIETPQNLFWNENTCTAGWDTVEKAEFYLIYLYRNETLISESVYEDFDASADVVRYSFLREMKDTGTYRFMIMAGYTQTDESNPQFGNYIVSDGAKSEDYYYDSGEPEWIDISSASQWIALANVTGKGTEYTSDMDAQYAAWSKYYRLTADIDFSNLTAKEQAQTKSIGNVNAEFSGVFDGNGHKITGLTLSSGDCGLFSYVGSEGILRNIVIDRANVLFSDNAATLCWINRGTIEGCGVINTNITADTGAIIGGMVSRNYGSIRDSYVLGGKLTANSTTANGHAGFVGGNYGTIQRCYSTMEVSTQSYCAGGFAGWADTSYNDTCVFEDCFALGNVSAAKGWSGGFVGRINSSHATFTNCYVSNKVTSENKPQRAYGFAGALGSEGYADDLGEDGAFSIEVPAENFKNCFYNVELTGQDHENIPTIAVFEETMKSGTFAAELGAGWMSAEGENNGFPYLKNLPAPQNPDNESITVQLMIALYDAEEYCFMRDGGILSITLDSTGNTRVIDVLDAAAEQGLLTYSYSVTPEYGRFIECINGHELAAPDGWMYMVNDILPDMSASLVQVKDGDCILWYQGTTQNLFRGPSWEAMETGGEEPEYIDISAPEQLLALAEGGEEEWNKAYRLTADLDMSGIDFPGIGTVKMPFRGVFDGNGHTISHLKISAGEASQGVGMFSGIQNATLKNITLTETEVTGGSIVGLLVGNASVKVSSESMARCENNLIGNCHVSGSVVALKNDNSGAYAGGLIGFQDSVTDSDTGISAYSSIDRCSSEVTVTAASVYAGGFIGGNYGYITNSYAKGSVNGTSGTGGFAGGNSGSIYHCYSEVRVQGNYSVGGFAGFSSGTVKNCYSTGEVFGMGTDCERIGGFLGGGSGEIKNSMSSGRVYSENPSGYVGGFAGYYEGALAGLAKDIQMSGCYGNCIRSEEDSWNALGNRQSSVIKAEQTVLDDMKLTDESVIRDKMKELFGVSNGNNGDDEDKDDDDKNDDGKDDDGNKGDDGSDDGNKDDDGKGDDNSDDGSDDGNKDDDGKDDNSDDDRDDQNREPDLKTQTVTGVKNVYQKSVSKKTFRLHAKASTKVTYLSSKPKVAAINRHTGKIRLKKPGKTIITITASGTGYRTVIRRVTLIVKPKKQRLPSLKAVGKNTLQVKIRRDKKVSGYQIVYSKSSRFVNAKTIIVKGNKKTVRKIKGLKTGKKYYVKVRSYKKIGKIKYYGGFSKKKSVRIK